jgi:hypothetical protein
MMTELSRCDKDQYGLKSLQLFTEKGCCPSVQSLEQAGGLAQEVELPTVCKALSLNPSKIKH